MLPKLMGAAVFSIGFFMLLLGLADLLGIAGLNYDFGKRVLVYLGGVILVLMGYFMARRLPRVETPPGEIIQTTTTEVQEPPMPPDHF
jgi:hypothetical protein